MFKHKRRNEGTLYEARQDGLLSLSGEAPNTRNKINEEVREELAGTETFLTDTQGLRLAYESPNSSYFNGSILYIAGTKDPIDFYDDLKLPFYQTRNTKRYKDVDKLIKNNAIEMDGKQHYGITDVISHSLGSAVGQQINNDYGNIFRSRSYGSPFVSRQQPEDTGTNLRIRGSKDIVSMFNGGSFAIPKGSLNPLYNHSYEDIANVKNKAGNERITREEFMGQFET